MNAINRGREMKMTMTTAVLIAVAVQAAAGASKPHPPLSADHQRMFCGDPDGDIAGAYARAVTAEVDALIASGEPNVALALAKMRARYCAKQAQATKGERK